jgi:nucleotide-binding universal stress UspA family protein
VSAPKSVIVGVDSTPQARAALEFAGLLSLRTGCRLLLAHVVPYELPSIGGWDDFEQGARAEAERLFKQAVSELAGEFDFETFVPVAKSDAQGLIDLAVEQSADMVIVGSGSGGALGRVLSGSVAERVLSGAPCAVTVVPAGYRAADHSLQKIVAGYDGGDESKRAVGAAVELARSAGAELALVAAIAPTAYVDPLGTTLPLDPLELQNAQTERLNAELDEAVAGIEAPPNVTASVEYGDAAHALAEAAGSGADMLVVGSRGYGPVGVVLLGSVSAKLMRHAPCPVMTVPRAKI